MTDSPIRRVLVCPLDYDHPQLGQRDGFRKVFGEQHVRDFDFMKSHRDTGSATNVLIEVATQFQPDWIWLQVQGSDAIAPFGIVKLRHLLPDCIITHWMGDCRLEVPDDLAAMCRATHATLISSVGQIPMYQATGAPRVDYVQIGLDWDEDVLGLPEWEPPYRVPDVVFIGGYYGHVAAFAKGTAQRLSAIRRLVAEGIDVGVVGRGWPSDIPVIGECTVKQQHHVYKRAKVALSINHFNDIELYYSDRQLISMASGIPVVCRYVPGLEREFADGIHCCMWETEDAMVGYVRRLLGDATHRVLIGERARERVMQCHSWEARIRDLVPKVTAWRNQVTSI